MIRIETLHKYLGDQKVLDDINLEVTRGSIFGLMGPNGAGKTTLIKMIMGILQPDSGQVFIDGCDVNTTPEIKGRVGYVADYQNYYANFSVKDMVNFYRQVYANWDENRFNELKNIFKLPERKKIRTLSKGMRTQLAVLLNLAIGPKLLVLDEPTSGLDPVLRRQLMNILMDEVAQNGTTIFISTHNLYQLERICDQIAIIHKGQLLLKESIDSLKQNVRKIQVAFAEQMPAEVFQRPEILKVEQQGRVYSIVVQNNLPEIMAELQQYKPLLLETIDMSLEDIFIYQMGGLGYDFTEIAPQ